MMLLAIGVSVLYFLPILFIAFVSYKDDSEGGRPGDS